MRKKWIGFMVLAMLLIALVPASAFATPPSQDNKISRLTIGDTTLPMDAEYNAVESTGQGWSYKDGVLTLDNYRGGSISLDDSMASSIATAPYTSILTIVLKGSNTITPTGFASDMGFLPSNIGGLRGTGKSSFILSGSGNLTITGVSTASPISISGGFLEFQLSQGAYIQIDEGSYSPAHPIGDSNDFEKLPAIMVSAPTTNNSISTRQEIRLNNNIIAKPNDGEVSSFSWEKLFPPPYGFRPATGNGDTDTSWSVDTSGAIEPISTLRNEPTSPFPTLASTTAIGPPTDMIEPPNPKEYSGFYYTVIGKTTGLPVSSLLIEGNTTEVPNPDPNPGVIPEPNPDPGVIPEPGENPDPIKPPKPSDSTTPVPPIPSKPVSEIEQSMLPEPNAIPAYVQLGKPPIDSITNATATTLLPPSRITSEIMVQPPGGGPQDHSYATILLILLIFSAAICLWLIKDKFN